MKEKENETIIKEDVTERVIPTKDSLLRIIIAILLGNVLFAFIFGIVLLLEFLLIMFLCSIPFIGDLFRYFLCGPLNEKSGIQWFVLFILTLIRWCVPYELVKCFCVDKIVKNESSKFVVWSFISGLAFITMCLYLLKADSVTFGADIYNVIGSVILFANNFKKTNLYKRIRQKK